MSQHNAPLPEAQNALAAAHRDAPRTLLLSPLASLRDHFAAHASDTDVRDALEYLGRRGALNAASTVMDRNAVARYAVADAMLKAREGA